MAAKLKQEILNVAQEVWPETITLARNILQTLLDKSSDMDRDQRRCFLGLVFRGLGFIHAEMGMTPESIGEMIEGPIERAKLRASQWEERLQRSSDPQNASHPTHRGSSTIH